MAQHAHMEGWQRAKAGLASATADLPTDFASTADKAKGLAADGAAWARENPGKATIYGAAGAVGLVTVAAPGAVAAPVLALGGFGSNGIVGGELKSVVDHPCNLIPYLSLVYIESLASGGI